MVSDIIDYLLLFYYFAPSCPSLPMANNVLYYTPRYKLVYILVIPCV